jgi:hypothetical protein
MSSYRSTMFILCRAIRRLRNRPASLSARMTIIQRRKKRENNALWVIWTRECEWGRSMPSTSCTANSMRHTQKRKTFRRVYAINHPLTDSVGCMQSITSLTCTGLCRRLQTTFGRFSHEQRRPILPVLRARQSGHDDRREHSSRAVAHERTNNVGHAWPTIRVGAWYGRQIVNEIFAASKVDQDAVASTVGIEYHFKASQQLGMPNWRADESWSD